MSDNTRLAAQMAAFVAGSDEPGMVHEELVAVPHRQDDGSYCCVARYWYEGGNEYAYSLGGDSADPCDEDDVPSAEEATKAWAEYARYVAETGTDPLHSYMAGEPTKVTDQYLLDIVPDAETGQPSLLQVMDLAHDGMPYYAVTPAAARKLYGAGSARAVPEWLAEYLSLDEHLVLQDFSDLNGLMNVGHAEQMWRVSKAHVRLLVAVEHWQETTGEELLRVKRAAAQHDLQEREFLSNL